MGDRQHCTLHNIVSETHRRFICKKHIWCLEQGSGDGNTAPLPTAEVLDQRIPCGSHSFPFFCASQCIVTCMS